MILRVYSIRDIKTDQFGNPVFLINDGHAIRTISGEVNRKDDSNMLSKYPGDFELFFLGEFDTDTGLFSTSAPKSVTLLDQLVQR